MGNQGNERCNKIYRDETKPCEHNGRCLANITRLLTSKFLQLKGIFQPQRILLHFQHNKKMSNNCTWSLPPLSLRRKPLKLFRFPLLVVLGEKHPDFVVVCLKEKQSFQR